VVRSKIGEKWQRKFFETKTDAETYAERKRIELLNQGREAVEFPCFTYDLPGGNWGIDYDLKDGTCSNFWVEEGF
jgi:hypothetical protein